MLEVGIVERRAGFPYIEGADVSSGEICAKETGSFRFKRDICRLK